MGKCASRLHHAARSMSRHTFTIKRSVVAIFYFYFILFFVIRMITVMTSVHTSVSILMEHVYSGQSHPLLDTMKTTWMTYLLLTTWTLIYCKKTVPWRVCKFGLQLTTSLNYRFISWKSIKIIWAMLGTISRSKWCLQMLPLSKTHHKWQMEAVQLMIINIEIAIILHYLINPIIMQL